MKNNEMMRLVLIIVSACVFIFLIHSYNNSNNLEQENFFAKTGDSPNNVNDNESVVSNESVDNELLVGNENSGDVLPAEEDENETFRTVPEDTKKEEVTLPNECYPKDVLTSQDLLPQDSNSTWAQTVPSGQGSLGDQNFLNAGFHVGINTVGQSLRNANLQLRSEPANPQLKVSPWLQSTIDPDANRRAMEIGA
tara:strand:- start:102 stop:686 length:585 start_codon:yes stop_codon:yes gene_type:complete